MRRCFQNTCNKKLRLTEGQTCRCELLFCNTHRYPEEHACKYDWHENHKKDLTKKLIIIKAKKIDNL